MAERKSKPKRRAKERTRPDPRFGGPKAGAKYGSLARVLTGVRQMTGMSQQQLADRIGKLQPSVAHWESGSVSISEATLDGYASGLGMSVEDLLRVGLDEILLAEVPKEIQGGLRQLLSCVRAIGKHPSWILVLAAALDAASAALDNQEAPDLRPVDRLYRSLDTVQDAVTAMRVTLDRGAFR